MGVAERGPEELTRTLVGPGRDEARDAERLEELLARYVEQRTGGGTVASAADLCRQSPQLLEALREGIREYEQLHLLLAQPSELVGRTLLHYRIIDKLGEGGMGEVSLAEDTKLGRQVALKLLPPGMASDPERFARFRREARLVASLNHANVVTLHAVEEAEGISFLTMERVVGETLGELIPPRGMDAGKAVEIAGQVLDALAAAHERGIVHRDLKPSNVMVGPDGRVKVLDFGLAKLLHPQAEDRDPDSKPSDLTRDGNLLGTLPYMSPEQLQGKLLDQRTDIFSFGVLLCEMMTGERPFRGDSVAELVSAILRDKPPAIGGRRPRLSRSLGRILRRCLEKDPRRRFPSAAEARDEIRKLAAGGVAAGAAGSQPGFRWVASIALAGAVVLALIMGRTDSTRGPSARGGLPEGDKREVLEPATLTPPSGVQGRPQRRLAVAVSEFENIRQDPEIDWLCAGIAEMLEIDLLQEQEIDVVDPDRADKVIDGSFVRSHDTLRIHFKLRLAADGEIVLGDRVQGRLEAGLFAMVDDLSRMIRQRLEISPRAAAAVSPSGLTSSVEAWRFFSEGMKLEAESKNDEAVLLLEEAVSLDPEFALALVNLGQLHASLGHHALGREATRRALENAEGIPIHLRYLIEGRFYGATWQSYPRAVEVYREGLEVSPRRLSLRSNLAILYGNLERFEDALREYEAIFDSGIASQKSYISIALAHAALGRFEVGHQILEEFCRRQPGNFYGHFSLGWYLVYGGRLDQAAAALRRSEQLRPGYSPIRETWWQLSVLRQDWAEAFLVAREMAESADPYTRWTGLIFEARTHLYRRQIAPALARFAESARAYPEPEISTAASHAWAARVLFYQGDAARALNEARLAQEEAPGQWPQLEGMFLAALAQQALGRPAEADRLAAVLGARAAANANAVEQRQLHHLRGLLALARGERRRAVAELRAAAALLAPRGIPWNPYVLADHVPVWFSLGEAELAAGQERAAAEWFRRVAESGIEHVDHPLLYVRGFERLAKIYGRLGEPEKAAAMSQRLRGFRADENPAGGHQ